MINNDEMLLKYLDQLVNSFFKIIPLYEEKNEGLEKYVHSLISNLEELENTIHLNYSYEYISLLTTLRCINTEINKGNPRKSFIKSEAFKGINIIKNTANKIRDGD